jgi:hypothetical protein
LSLCFFILDENWRQTYAQMVAVWYGGTSYKAGKPYSRQGETGLSRSSKIGWGFYSTVSISYGWMDCCPWIEMQWFYSRPE